VLAAGALLGHPRWAAAQAGTSPAPLAPSRMEQPPPAAPPPDGPAPSGAFAVTAVVIVLASSDSGAPRTNLGNMPAF
jgi:hypothetical protein